VSYSFLPEAEDEYLGAVGFYEQQRAGLGASLIREFERTIQHAVELPHACKSVVADIRRANLDRFPYAVFFRALSDGHLQITAFAHHRRRPGYWYPRMP
jgi:plasmid stabilization system protein ParE